MAGNIFVYNIGFLPCRLRGTPGVALLRPSGEVLSVTVNRGGNKAAVGDTFGGVLLLQGSSARAFLVRSNWCGTRTSGLDVRVTLPETGETVVGHVLDMISEPSPTTYYPRCDVPDSESLVSVDPFQR